MKDALKTPVLGEFPTLPACVPHVAGSKATLDLTSPNYKPSMAFWVPKSSGLWLHGMRGKVPGGRVFLRWRWNPSCFPLSLYRTGTSGCHLLSFRKILLGASVGILVSSPCKLLVSALLNSHIQSSGWPRLWSLLLSSLFPRRGFRRKWGYRNIFNPSHFLQCDSSTPPSYQVLSFPFSQYLPPSLFYVWVLTINECLDTIQ